VIAVGGRFIVYRHVPSVQPLRTMSKLRWGDAVEDEDVLPDNVTTGPNDKGVLTKTEYYHNSKGEATKKTTKIQLVKVQTKVYEV
jgi:hypothetical protein